MAASPTEVDTAAPRVTANGIVRGFRQGIPFGLATMAFGAAFGILAAGSGLGDATALAMSVLVYSGTAQMLGLELRNADASVLAIWGATALVSLRYVLFGMTMRDWFRGLPPAVTFGALLLSADQSWALAQAEMAWGRRDAGVFLGAGGALFLGWTGGTLLGTLAGGAIPDPDAFGLGFAAIAAFIGILAGMFRGRPDLVPWTVAAIVALLTERLASGHWYVVAGALAGSAAALPGAIGAGRRHGP